MRELGIRELGILNKIQSRTKMFITDDDLNFLETEHFRRGTFTGCIITLRGHIVGIGMTKKYKYDKESQYVADDVSFAKAAKDYLIGEEAC